MKNRKCIFCLLSMLVCLLLSGCNGTKREEETEDFHAVQIMGLEQSVKNQGLDVWEAAGIAYRDGKQFVLINGYTEKTGEVECGGVICRIEGKQVSDTMPLENLPDMEIRGFDVGPDGRFYILGESYDEAAEHYMKYLVVVGADGQMKLLAELDAELEETDAVAALQIDENGSICIFCESGRICIFDENGKWLKHITTHEGNHFLEACRNADNQIIFVTAEYVGEQEKLEIFQLLAEQETSESVVELEEGQYDTNILINGAGTCDFCLNGREYVCQYSMAEKKMLPLVSWKQADIDRGEIEKIIYSEDGFTILQGKQQLALLEQGEPGMAQNRKALRLGCVYTDDSVQKQVAAFNRENQEYAIEIVSYEENENPYQSLAVDLAAGKEMDIILLPEQNAEVFLEKGLLADLYSFMEQDGEIKKEDFLPNVLEAFETDGKLYQTISRVYISGWVTKKSNVDVTREWDINALKELLKNNSDAALFCDASSADIIDEFMDGMMDGFVDWSSGNCDFRSEAFQELLEIAETYGKEQDAIPAEDEITCLRENKLLFSHSNDMSPLGVELYDTALNGDFVFVGTPGMKGSSTAFRSADGQYGIVEGSKNKEGAWQFARMFLLKDYQDISENVIMYGVDAEGIPVRKDCFEEFLKRFTATEPYERDGVWIEPIQGEAKTSTFSYTMAPLTVSQEKMFNAIVMETDRRTESDFYVKEIVCGEAEYYFSGEKSLAETVDIIQDRVNTYLNEKK